jgi:hypothetical protein
MAGVVHGHQVAEQHGGGLHEDFAQGDRGELERKAARGEDAALDRLRHLPEMRVAARQLRPRVGDADDRPPVEHGLAEALGLHPRAVGEAVEILLSEPVAASQQNVGHAGGLLEWGRAPLYSPRI